MFNIRNICVLAYGNGFTLWHYKSTEDTLKTIVAPGYFNDATDMFREGDMIMISTKGGGAIVTVTENLASSVFVAPLV